jgi:hypothetical protein
MEPMFFTEPPSFDQIVERLSEGHKGEGHKGDRYAL